jgi:hypothetical protein
LLSCIFLLDIFFYDLGHPADIIWICSTTAADEVGSIFFSLKEFLADMITLETSGVNIKARIITLILD